jgi:cation:H+ antiporter
MILIASHTVVEGVQLLGKEINVNDALIGLFVLGIGTNTPELALLLRAKDFSQTKLAIGDFLGSVVFNTPTLGLLAILSGGFKITNFVSIVPVLVLIVFACILFWYFAITDKELSRKEGILLFAVFVSLIISEVIFALS